MSLQIGIPSNVLSEKYLSEYYEKLFVQKANLFQSVLHAFNFLNNEMERRYNNPKSEDK